MSMNTQANKKAAFEPKLLIFEGTEVAQQERRAHSQQAFSDLYSGRADLFISSTPQNLSHIDHPQELQNGIDLIGNYGQYYQGQQNFQLGLQQQQHIGLEIGSSINYAQIIKKSESNNEVSTEKMISIKLPKPSNDIQNQSQFVNQQSQSQQQIQQQYFDFPLQTNSQIQYFRYQQQESNANGQVKKLAAKNDSAGSLSKQQTNHNNSSNNLPISSIKNNVKNTYIKKISSLMNSNGDLINEGGEKNGNIKEEMSDDDQDDGSNSKSSDNKQGDDSNDNKRLKKNRESARNSRQRKKIYIDLLEKKVGELNKNIEEVCLYIDKSQENISSILERNPFLRGLVQERLGLIEKIQKNIYDQKPNEDELNLICDSFRLRLGATGRIRQNAIQLFFKHMHKAFLENNYQFFLYGYDHNQDDEDDEFNRCVDIFKETVGLPENDNQIYSALPILKKFLEHRKQFKKIFKEMKNHQKEWKQKTATVENLVDKISPLLTSSQVGKLIDFIDKKRKQPELQWMKKKYNLNTTPSLPHQIGGQFIVPNSQFTANNPLNSLTSTLAPPMMTPSQILQANSTSVNNFGYPVSNNHCSQIKHAPFQSNLDCQVEQNNILSNANQNLMSEDAASNFYNHFQFQNYRMYPPMFQMQQPPYFGAQSSLDSNGHLLSNQISNHNQNLSTNSQQIGAQAYHQGMTNNDQIFQNHSTNNPNIFDLLPPKEEVKQGTIGASGDQYYLQEGVHKKRKQY